MKEWEIADKFALVNHLRTADRCCRNCTFGSNEIEGGVKCQHPSLRYWDEFLEETTYADIQNLGASQSTVCDLWRKKPKGVAP